MPQQNKFALIPIAVLFTFVGCSSPKADYPTKFVQSLAVSLPEGFSETDQHEAEQTIRQTLGSWPLGTTVSIAIQPLTIDPRASLKDTWSDSIGTGTEGGLKVGGGVGEVVDFLLLRAPVFKVALGASGFVIGAVGGTIIGPISYGFDRIETWNLREYNFIAAFKIDVPGKPAIKNIFIDRDHYPIKGPVNPKDKIQNYAKRKESLNVLLNVLTTELTKLSKQPSLVKFE